MAGRPSKTITLEQGQSFCHTCRSVWQPSQQSDFNNGKPKIQCSACRQRTKETYQKRKQEEQKRSSSNPQVSVCVTCKNVWSPTTPKDMIVSKGIPRKKCPSCRAGIQVIQPPVQCITCKLEFQVDQDDFKNGRRIKQCKQCRPISSSLPGLLSGLLPALPYASQSGPSVLNLDQPGLPVDIPRQASQNLYLASQPLLPSLEGQFSAMNIGNTSPADL